MLSANEFTVGTLALAKPLAIVLPRTKFEQPALIAGTSDVPVAICLDPGSKFQSFPCKGNTHWKGLIVPNVCIEVDEGSLYDPSSVLAQVGSVVRTGPFLMFIGNSEGLRGIAQIVLEEGLESATNEKVGFTRWQVVLGSGVGKRCLWQSAASEKPQEGLLAI